MILDFTGICIYRQISGVDLEELQLTFWTLIWKLQLCVRKYRHQYGFGVMQFLPPTGAVMLKCLVS